jgi:hypothetical protein
MTKDKLPRIVQRRPYQGDVHPVDKKHLQRMLTWIPFDMWREYLHGLKRIELRARNGLVGKPYGYYRRADKTIVLFSLPMRWTWNLSETGVTPRSLRVFDTWDVDIELAADTASLRWGSEDELAWWFFSNVILHELGHHHRYQYRFQNRRASYYQEEYLADMHANRLWREAVRAMRSR